MNTEATSVRTCVGCREAHPQHALVRLAVVDEPPFLVPDARRKLGGRGVWVMPDPECIEKAARRGGFARALRRKVQVDPAQLTDLLSVQLERRLQGLALGARRSGRIAIGTEASQESLRLGRARALWLARDAGQADRWRRQADDASIPCIVSEDRVWLGGLFGRQTVAIAAIEDDGLASAIEQATRHLVGLRHGAERSKGGPQGQRIEGQDE
ncbi:MAG: DUF448 domain-containing protein [Myxococcota bacterium]